LSAAAPRPEATTRLLAGPGGVLECLIEQLAPPALARGVAVLCHPHPLHGGTLHNKVVHTLARAALALGMVSWRFNFRGVGQSSGQHDQGLGETDDVLAVIQAARQESPGLPLLLAGFSFGGAVAIRAAGSAPPDWLITVAPAVDRVPMPPGGLFNGRWLVLHGEADEVVPIARTAEWLPQAAPSAQLQRLPGVGHFFHGALAPLQAAVLDFCGAASADKKCPAFKAPGD
jgi:uncharacterized protein